MVVRVINDKCVGCGICVKSCPFDAIVMKDKKAVITDACTSCNVCIEKCPFDAIVKVEDFAEKKDLSEYKGVWIFAEQRENTLMPVVFELLGEGRKLADEIGTELAAIVCGENVSELTKELFAYGADKVYVADHKDLKSYRTDSYTKVISEAIETFKPEILLLGASHIGRDLGPTLAVTADTGLTADCTSLEIDPDDKKIRQTRPAFGGNLMATIVCPNHRPQMSTVRPGVMDKAEYNRLNEGEIINLDVSFEEGEIRTEVVEFVKSLDEVVSLADADVIVSGGLGIGSEEGFELLKELAKRFDGTIAASRASVDSGWIDSSYQIGQTGTTVKPTVYIACGISGAIQHIAGMKDSDYIIAINKNESAPIFNVADLGIVGDLHDVIPAIIEELDK